MLWKQGTLQCQTRTPYCEGYSKARPGTDLTPLDLMAFIRNNLQRKRSSERGIMYYVHTDSGLGFTQQGWMPTPGSLVDTDQSQRLLLSSFKGSRTHSYRMKGRKRVWSCSLQNSEKALPAHCSSLSRPISDAHHQLLTRKSRSCFYPKGKECCLLRCRSPAAPEGEVPCSAGSSWTSRRFWAELSGGYTEWPPLCWHGCRRGSLLGCCHPLGRTGEW